MSRRARIGTAVAAVLVVVAAIALTGVAGAVLDRDASGPARAAADTVILTVAFTRQPGSTRQVAHVRCTTARATADGFLRRVGARRACAHAQKIVGLLTSGRDPGRACSQIFGGPERALVTGRVGDRRIHRSFKRTDGCEVADWRRAMPLLPRPS